MYKLLNYSLFNVYISATLFIIIIIVSVTNYILSDYKIMFYRINFMPETEQWIIDLFTTIKSKNLLLDVTVLTQRRKVCNSLP